MILGFSEKSGLRAEVDLGLHYGSSSSSPSPARIGSVLKKEAVCEWEGKGMAAKCW